MSAVTTDGALTEAGWPRPRVGRWPVPWISPSLALSKMSPARYEACASGAVCAVCGLGHQETDRAIAIVRLEPGQAPPSDLSAGTVLPMDNAVMHRPCARLAVGTCPVLRQLRADGLLLLVEVTAHEAVVESADDDTRHRAAYDGEGCAVVPIEEL